MTVKQRAKQKTGKKTDMALINMPSKPDRRSKLVASYVFQAQNSRLAATSNRPCVSSSYGHLLALPQRMNTICVVSMSDADARFHFRSLIGLAKMLQAWYWPAAENPVTAKSLNKLNYNLFAISTNHWPPLLPMLLFHCPHSLFRSNP